MYKDIENNIIRRHINPRSRVYDTPMAGPYTHAFLLFRDFRV